MKDTETLPAILDLKAAAPLHRMLLDQRGADLQISGAQVQRLGAQCLQVLLSAQTAWMVDGKVLTITEPSAELVTSLELFGLDDPAAVFGREQCA
jgi:chemotaxis protein CheX